MTGAWYITPHAVGCYMRIRRYAEDARERALRELTDLAPSAHYADSDSQGRQIWRTGRPLRLRWLVSFASRSEGEAPQVIWVGQGRPPEKMWAP